MTQPTKKAAFKRGDVVYVPAVNWSSDDCADVGVKRGKIITVLVTTCGEYNYQIWEDGTNNFHGCYNEQDICLTPERARKRAIRQVRDHYKMVVKQLRQRVAERRKLLEAPMEELRNIRKRCARFEESLNEQVG